MPGGRKRGRVWRGVRAPQGFEVPLPSVTSTRNGDPLGVAGRASYDIRLSR